MNYGRMPQSSFATRCKNRKLIVNKPNLNRLKTDFPSSCPDHSIELLNSLFVINKSFLSQDYELLLFFLYLTIRVTSIIMNPLGI